MCINLWKVVVSSIALDEKIALIIEDIFLSKEGKYGKYHQAFKGRIALIIEFTKGEDVPSRSYFLEGEAHDFIEAHFVQRLSLI